MKLRTIHGAYVVSRGDGDLLHLPEPLTKDVKSVWDGAPPPAVAPGAVEAAISHGALAPSTMVLLPDGLVAFRRDGLYLCADPSHAVLRFDRPVAGPWERFAIENADGTWVRLTPRGPWAYPPSPSRPILVETPMGYQIKSADDDAPTQVSAPEFAEGPINRDTMGDGSWIVDVDRAPDLDQPFFVYWLYPFDARVHVWRLDRAGRRQLGYDLFDSDVGAFLSSRRALGVVVTVRLYLLALKAGDRDTLASLRPDLLTAAEAGSAEALYAVLSDPLAYAPAIVQGFARRACDLIRAVNRAPADEWDIHLARFMVAALSDALVRLGPALGGLPPDQLHGERDLSAYFFEPRHLPPADCAVPFTLHRHTEERLAQVLGGQASEQTIGIFISPDTRAVAFHYVKSHMLPRTILSIRYAYYVLCINQSAIWERLAALEPQARGWIMRLEAGDLPLADAPSVAFERRLGDTRYALAPDPYYFDSKGFRHGWFRGEAPSWSEKATRFVWRGSTTGAGDLTRETIWGLPRVRLCALGREIGAVADFGITNVVQTRTEADAHDIRLALQEQRLWREPMPQHVMGAAKFLIEIDGNANSWGFFAKLLMGCCVLKVDSPYEEWFYARLRPWIHYVPVAHDLLDLPNKVKWCLQNEETCRTIAETGRRFAESLGFEVEMAAAADAFIAVARPG
jgi:hypothetical protein